MYIKNFAVESCFSKERSINGHGLREVLLVKCVRFKGCQGDCSCHSFGPVIFLFSLYILIFMKEYIINGDSFVALVVIISCLYQSVYSS